METVNSSHQHFSVAAPETVTFSRPISNLILTVSTANVTMAFDGSSTPFSLAQGTYQFLGLKVKTISFGGSGNASGCGIS